MQKLIELVDRLGAPRVVLVGDFMLDRWVYGEAERLSQEAPVPVLRVIRSDERTGAAGNVAAAVAALGGRVSCVGAIGDDEPGAKLRELLAAAGAKAGGLLAVAGRPTTVKTRYVGLAQHKNPQQILRVDTEVTDGLDEAACAALARSLAEAVSGDCVLAIQDHNKGVITDRSAEALIALARGAGRRVIVDPALVSDYSRYRGATLLTPNRYEAALASGVKIDGEASRRQAADRILDVTGAEAVMITLDREGIYLAWPGGQTHSYPPRTRAVYDGTGAGDAVLAAVAVAVAEGWSLPDATDLANVVGGLEVERFGVVPIARREVSEELRRIVGLRGSKVLLREPLAEELARRRTRGEKIVFTNGCFDLLHMGHVRYLQQARKLGSCLVVAINSDESVRGLKGESRPVIGQDERADMLGALECVDYVTIFDEDTPIPLLETLRPDLLVKGGTTDAVVGREVVEAHGGEVRTLDAFQGLSTTRIIERIVNSRSPRKGAE
jgi:D-beta-D-heptose 7-phosphate kinase/D-beta-D-heptose 1-phosphate adenosyltransferase